MNMALIMPAGMEDIMVDAVIMMTMIGVHAFGQPKRRSIGLRNIFLIYTRRWKL
ncbi:MAG: hypothetical protein AB1345_13350 [Chloroflexota bacterium]